MFKVINKDTRTTPTSVSIVNFDQLNANWEVNINPFHSTGPFYTFWKYQKTSNFWCFQRVKKQNSGMNWIKNTRTTFTLIELL